jgi:predicted  nucleic acid-binding Zn-ribbon protein
MSDLTNKDAEQDSKLAVLESRIESFRERLYGLEYKTQNIDVIESTLDNALRRIELVHERIDKTENKIKELDNELRQRIRVLERWVAGAGAVIAAATTIMGLVLAADSKEVNYGRNGSPQQEVVLQLPRS